MCMTRAAVGEAHWRGSTTEELALYRLNTIDMLSTFGAAYLGHQITYRVQFSSSYLKTKAAQARSLRNNTVNLYYRSCFLYYIQ